MRFLYFGSVLNVENCACSNETLVLSVCALGRDAGNTICVEDGHDCSEMD